MSQNLAWRQEQTRLEGLVWTEGALKFL